MKNYIINQGFKGHDARLKFVCLIAYIVLSIIIIVSSNAHALDVPKLQGYINDYADMISPSAKAELEQELKVFEQTDSTQVVILTIPTLEQEVIEDFGIKVGDAWKIGQNNKDNGIIFIVAKQERKMRIEVGRGLEGRLTDLMAGRIIDLVVKPRFKRGDYDGGFIAGISSVIDATRGEFKADGNRNNQNHNNSSYFLTFLVFCFIAILVIGTFSRIAGGVAGAIGLPALVHFILSPMTLGLFIILGLFGSVLGFILPYLFSSSGHGSGRGGFMSGTVFSGGGFSSGGGSFGGGFSGGGGGFGGGGASGSW
ncbi:MAG: TPM domain-containing protein [Deltaproteobacteria bacterium]|nr:TPM domain-containing protein [Deltaproteobacteria bacterium]